MAPVLLFKRAHVHTQTHTHARAAGGFGICLFCGGVSVVDSLFIVAFVTYGGFVFGPCFAMQYLVSFLVLQLSG